MFTRNTSTAKGTARIRRDATEQGGTTTPGTDASTRQSDDVTCLLLVKFCATMFKVSLPPGAPMQLVKEACPVTCAAQETTATPQPGEQTTARASTLPVTIAALTTAHASTHTEQQCEGGVLYRFEKPLPNTRGRAGNNNKFIVATFTAANAATPVACATHCIGQHRPLAGCRCTGIFLALFHASVLVQP